MPIIFLCQNEYTIGCTHSQISIGLGSLIWILSKRHLTDAQILLNYIMVKVQLVYQESMGIEMFYDLLQEINSVLSNIQNKE